MGRQRVGTGIFMWDSPERKSNRYGAFYLSETNFEGDVTVKVKCDVAKLVAMEGRRVRVVCRVRQARKSGHMGDVFLRIKPSKPEVGEEIDLGVSTLEVSPRGDGTANFVLKPNDGRTKLWLDPRKLYRLHDQTVEVWIEETTDDFTAAPEIDTSDSGAVMVDSRAFQVKDMNVEDVRAHMISEHLGDGLFRLRPKPLRKGTRLS